MQVSVPVASHVNFPLDRRPPLEHLLFESGELSSRGLVITRLVYFARV